MNKNIKLTEQQIATILNEHLNENFWIFQLGQATSGDLIGSDNDFSFPFYEKGKELLEKYKPILKSMLCDTERMCIKSTIDEVVLGNVRELIYLIICTLCESHNLSLSLAIPLAALVIKYGLQNFCSK